MSVPANGASSSLAMPSVLTLIAVAIGAALYFGAGPAAFFLHLICAPFAIFFLWASWRAPTLDERYAQPTQTLRDGGKRAPMREAAAH